MSLVRVGICSIVGEAWTWDTCFYWVLWLSTDPLQLLRQPTANVANGSNIHDPVTHVWEPHGVPGSWYGPCPSLTIITFWRVKRWNICLAITLCYPSFQISKQVNKLFKTNFNIGFNSHYWSIYKKRTFRQCSIYKRMVTWRDTGKRLRTPNSETSQSNKPLLHSFCNEPTIDICFWLSKY